MPVVKRNYIAGSTHRLSGLIAVLVLLEMCVASCQKSYRRDDPSSHDGGGQPGSRVEAASDPRFPGSREQTERTGLRVEQPVESGSFSATSLANGVADHLPDVEKRCCTGASNRCDGMSGRILLELKIAADGEVLEVTVVESTLHRRAFRTCMTGRAGHWRLPGPRGNAPEEVMVPVRARYAESGEK